MKSLNEIEKRVTKINPKIKCNKKMLEVLTNVILDDEEILYATYGTVICKSNISNVNETVKNTTVFITNKRVFLAIKNILSYNSENIPLESIRGISSNKILFRTQIVINNNSDSTKITVTTKQEANQFINILNKQIDNYKSFKIEINNTTEKDILDKIEKLSELHKDGVLTDYEFSIKKMELLDKLKK